MLERNRMIQAYVGATALAAAGAAYLSSASAGSSPGLWPLVTFIAVSFLLGLSPNTVRVAAKGTTSFVAHIAAGLLFGAFWGGLVAGVSTILSQVQQGARLDRVIFNTAQRLLSVTLAILAYQLLGGSVPPSYLVLDQVSTADVQRDLFLFFCIALIYFAVNKATVAGASALSSGRPFREVWYLNFRGIIGFDLGASALAVLIAWLYVQADRVGYGPIGLVLAVAPIVFVRHVYRMYYDLQESGEELLELMVKAIEARDPYTSGHSIRVRSLSRAIALELDLPARDLEEVETAALLHDVGKIHEEFAPLLRKESRLTPEEMALMQTHAVRSAELVGIISKFRGGVQRAVRHHHERWDGQGYPDGIQGEEIPLASRIILISDTIDAMTTDRPYRKRLSLEVVVAELQKCKGTQFDPRLVEAAVSSVALRSLIVNGAVESHTVDTVAPFRSRKVGGLAATLLKPRRVLP